MDALPNLIKDLALILIVAGVVTILFKRLRQPLVLGYIVAGFLTGPHMPYIPSISDQSSIETWSQIGVIFLMFSIGLEFSFSKIVRMGIKPVITTCCIMMSMMGIGCGIGYLLEWNLINCIFLGGMLSMSSTTIIYKAFDDLSLLNKRFAGGVLTVLILEDILGIVIMVVLQALAVSSRFQGGELLRQMLHLVFFLVLWFLVGMWLIPQFLHKNRRFINEETLLIVSIGLCFLMVVIATSMGYNAALGAFVMGSLMAETLEAEKIEHAIAPVKDLFGAIFFVSVGMLVSPEILMQYALPILILVCAVVFGQMLFGTMSFLLTGTPLRSAILSGFSMVQIGEFAFIIAVLGQQMQVTDSFLYPVIVSVSIITTFLTPYCIKLAGKINTVIPQSPIRSNEKSALEDSHPKGQIYVWTSLLHSILLQTIAYSILSLAVLGLLFVSILLICRQLLGHWAGNAVCGIITLLVLSLFLRPIVMKKNHSLESRWLYRRSLVNKFLLSLLFIVRFVFVCGFIYYVLDFLSPYKWYLHIAVSIFLLILIINSRTVKYLSVKMERTFIQNLRRREQAEHKNTLTENPCYARRLKGRDLHIARLCLPSGSMWAGSTLAQLRIGMREQVHIVAIVRDGERINIPGGRIMLFPHDIIEVLGDDESIELFCQHMTSDVQSPLLNEKNELRLQRIIITPNSPLIGLFIKQSGIRDKYHCMVVGFEDSDGSLSIANADRVINRGDTLWIVGEIDNIEALKKGLA